MALGNQSNKIYLSVSNGKIVRKVAEGSTGAEPFTKTDGTIIWQQRFSYVNGYLRGISIKKGEYNGAETKDFCFDMEDGGEAYTLQMPYDGRNAVSLIKALCNPAVDFSKKITITPWLKVVDGKKKMSCFLKQGDTDVPWYFTREETHGMPELTAVKIKGKDTWDNYDQMLFLEGFLEKNVKPKLSSHGSGAIDNDPPFAPDEISPDDDDLPF